MPNSKNTYDSHAYGDRLRPGTEIKIEHSVYLRQESLDISELASLPLEKLQADYDNSVKAETEVFEKLCATTKEWESHAVQSQLLKRAIEYLKIPAVEHTANEWQINQYGNDEISNMVYMMFFGVYEQTAYNRETQKSEPIAWHVTWNVGTNSKSRYSANIAGQDKKHFTDKTAAEKYIAGRKKAYANLFTEISPPIPKEFLKCFTVNNLLLPGYTMMRGQTKMLNREQIEHIKEQYPPGTRIELLSMEDPYAPVPPGTRGTVSTVDDAGQLHMLWDNGRTLAVIPGEDSFRVISETEEKQENEQEESELSSDTPQMGGQSL